MGVASSRAVTRLRELSRTREFGKVLRYVTVSGISTVLSLAMLYVFYRKVGLSVRSANITATVIATVPSYYLNRTWAWGRTGKSHFRREVLPFWTIAAISLVLSTLAVQFAESESLRISSSKQVQTLLVLFANFFTYGVIWIGKFILFNKVLFVQHGTDDKTPVVLVPVEVTANDPASTVEVGARPSE